MNVLGVQLHIVRRWKHRLANPVWMGNLRRIAPVTRGRWQRGTPVDRFYIEQFLDTYRQDIRDSVIEVRDAGYTRKFGTGVARSEVLDIDASNAEATIVADLAAADALPSEAFSCFVLTQTLQYIYDLDAAIKHVHRILRPGGVVLASVPTIAHVETTRCDLWRFTPLLCEQLFGKYFGRENTSVQPRGNVLSAVAFLNGLAAEEFKQSELAAADPEYPLVICVRAVKR